MKDYRLANKSAPELLGGGKLLMAFVADGAGSAASSDSGMPPLQPVPTQFDTAEFRRMEREGLEAERHLVFVQRAESV